MEAEELLRRLLRSLLKRGVTHDAAHPIPLWSFVATYCGLGSSSSYQLCLDLGLDPSEWFYVDPDFKEVE